MTAAAILRTEPSALPTALLRKRFLAGLRQVFALFEAPTPEIRGFIASTLLVRDSTTLLNGLSGTGKTHVIRTIHRTFFDGRPAKDDLGYVACAQDLTPLDALFHLDLAGLLRGEENVSPRAVVTARLKFINEVQRASTLLFNGLLPLLSEKHVVFRDRIFKSPSFVCYLDANPLDSGSTEMPQAFRDRIDFSFDMPVLPAHRALALEDRILADGTARFGDLIDVARPFLTSLEMESLWEIVRRMPIPAEARHIAALLAAHLQACRHTDRSRASADYLLPCRECPNLQDPCAKLAEIPGTRFLLSLLKLAQARAWLRDASEVGVEDLLYGLPYTLSHRLKLRPESRRLYPSAAAWIREELYRRSVRHRIPKWRQLAAYLLSETPPEPEVLRALTFRDQAIESLVGDRLAPTRIEAEP